MLNIFRDSFFTNVDLIAADHHYLDNANNNDDDDDSGYVVWCLWLWLMAKWQLFKFVINFSCIVLLQHVNINVHFSKHRKNCETVSKVKSLKDHSLKVLSKCICHGLCICIRCCLFVGQVMFSHHPDQMSQRSKVSKIILWRYSLNVIVTVFVFVVVFLLVR